MKPVPGFCRSPAHQPVASYCGKAAPGGWDVRAPSLLHCQGPQLTGGRGATQFCLIGQLEGWCSAVWEKAQGVSANPRGCLLAERPRGRREEPPGSGGRWVWNGWVGHEGSEATVTSNLTRSQIWAAAHDLPQEQSQRVNVSSPEGCAPVL